MIQIKLHYHKQYGMSRTDKHEIGKYKTGKDKTSEYIHLIILERVTSITM